MMDGSEKFPIFLIAFSSGQRHRNDKSRKMLKVDTKTQQRAENLINFKPMKVQNLFHFN